MKIKKGDIVTPVERVNRTTKGEWYTVTRTDKDVFYIIDDWNIERQCYPNEWEIVSEEEIKKINEINLSWLVFVIFALSAMIIIVSLVSCSANYHYGKFIKKGGKIDTTERVVEVEKLVKLHGKDSVIKLKIPVNCPQVQIPPTRQEIRYKYKLQRDSIQTIRYVTKWKTKEIKSKVKNKFWNGVLLGIFGTIMGYFLLGMIIGMFTKIK